MRDECNFHHTSIKKQTNLQLRNKRTCQTYGPALSKWVWQIYNNKKVCLLLRTLVLHHGKLFYLYRKLNFFKAAVRFVPIITDVLKFKTVQAKFSPHSNQCQHFDHNNINMIVVQCFWIQIRMTNLSKRNT